MRIVCFFQVLLAVLSLPAAALNAQDLRLREYRAVWIGPIELAYREFGSGMPVVLLHGNGNSGVMWDPVIPELARHYRVIVPDLRGYGRSTNPAGLFRFADAAQDVLALLDSLGVHMFRAVGNSGGAMVLLHVATAAPDRVESMILQTGTSYFPAHVRAMALADSPETWTTESLEDMVRREVATSVEQAREIRNYFHALKDLSDDMNFTPELLSRISARTLIVHGDRDSYFPVEIALEQYRSIPHAYLWVLPNHDHYVGMPVEVWLDFFSGRWWRSRGDPDRR
jgi:pimeloyl-ACP methyl ester carboxylesterase